MADTYSQKMEEEEKLFPHRNAIGIDRAKYIFNALASAGANNVKLARLLIAWDFSMSLLQWDVKLTDIVTNYQASVDSEYHKDYVRVATIEELDERYAKRRSNSLLRRNENQDRLA